MKLCSINVSTWKQCAVDRAAWRLVVRKGVQRAEEDRNEGLTEKWPGGSRNNGSLSRHRHSPTANAADTVTLELACLATRAGADKTNWTLHQSSLIDGRMPTTETGITKRDA